MGLAGYSSRLLSLLISLAAAHGGDCNFRTCKYKRRRGVRQDVVPQAPAVVRTRQAGELFALTLFARLLHLITTLDVLYGNVRQ